MYVLLTVVPGGHLGVGALVLLELPVLFDYVLVVLLLGQVHLRLVPFHFV